MTYFLFNNKPMTSLFNNKPMTFFCLTTSWFCWGHCHQQNFMNFDTDHPIRGGHILRISWTCYDLPGIYIYIYILLVFPFLNAIFSKQKGRNQTPKKKKPKPNTNYVFLDDPADLSDLELPRRESRSEINLCIVSCRLSFSP